MTDEILHFWFEELEPSQWWVKDEDLDRLIAERFAEIHKQATRCELFAWRENADGRLAEIIILDQFSRNMYRGTPQAFSSDPLALALAQEAVAGGFDQQLPQEKRGFIYLPFMHSESIKIHEIAKELYSQPGFEASLEWEIKHKNIIARFGRYPHRNAILGRDSSEEEIEFLRQPGSSF